MILRFLLRKPSPWRLVALALVTLLPRAAAAPDAAAWDRALSSLSHSEGRLPVITLPAGLLDGSPGSAEWHFARSALLLPAAEMATAQGFMVRAAQLWSEAESSLLSARSAGLPPGQAAQCAFLLGQLAERVDRDLASAESFYQEAVSRDSLHPFAGAALRRLQTRLGR